MLLSHLIRSHLSLNPRVQSRGAILSCFRVASLSKTTTLRAETGILLWIIRHQQVPRTKRTRRYFFRTYSFVRYLVYKGSQYRHPRKFFMGSNLKQWLRAESRYDPQSEWYHRCLSRKGGYEGEARGDHQETADIRVCHARKNTPMSTGQCTWYVVGHFKVMN